MKVSEITNETLATYLKLTFTELTEAEKSELTTLINIAKAFIMGYTGQCNETIIGEAVGIGDGETIIFNTLHCPLVPGTVKIYANDVQLSENTDYMLDYSTGEITFITAPTEEITADYSAGIDAYEDFVIAVYVLCQDMYDNRVYYVDKTNINKVIDTILGMHSINLL